jgi:ribosomal protein S18 acetylase RimI-like enzyme
MIELIEARCAEDYAIARSLFEEYAASLSVDLCFQGFQHELEQLPQMYGPPGGCLILGREADVAVACVEIRRVAAADCELKRLFVKERARGFGLGRRLTLEAVQAARRLDYSRMFLDTLPEMKAARHLYATLGFRETAPYYPNPVEGAYFMVLDVRSH